MLPAGQSGDRGRSSLPAANRCTLPAMITCLVARDNVVREFDVKDLAKVLEDRRARVWVDLENVGMEGFEALRPALEFHPLAVEDCVTDINHPKVDDYRDYLYLAVHSAR